MIYKKLHLLTIGLCVLLSGVSAQQISIHRIDLMPDKPTPYSMRNWKQVAVDYDNFVFDTSKTGINLPLTKIAETAGINYSGVNDILMDTYIGWNSHNVGAEAINIIPAVVGASLVGIDKTTHLGTNWVTKIKDFYNLKNGENVFLNNYSGSTGNDWWYEIMPNVFFYQLYGLYPNIDSDFETQFTTIADRELNVLFQLGARLQPWTTPKMNYRAFNLLTGQPNSNSVSEPESAGSIAWLLYQAYVKTQSVKYLQGAELALEFLLSQNSNPSYEIQLPYGIVTAARMNAVEGTNYDIEKLMNWTFSSGIGTLRGWGTITGNWNGYDVSGLIGEANDRGNDYAFSMNGFQHAAALAPVVKYDKRFAKAIGKWILNLANASRLFYANGLADKNQQTASNTWAKQYDTNNCIPFESIKQTWGGKSPFAMGDAVSGGWADTDLSLYSGSSVGYLASIISTTNIEGILQIDLNRTDFRGENAYPTYLYYNPYSSSQSVQIDLRTAANYDLYDAISEMVIKTDVSGTVNFSLNAGSTRIIVVIPSGKSKQTVGHIRKIYEGGVIDYHYGYNYDSPLRIKAFTSDTTRAVSPNVITFKCLTENNQGTTTYNWYQNETLISTTTLDSLKWTAPSTSGVYTFKCKVTNNNKTVTSNEINITVAPEGEIVPIINSFSVSGTDPYGVNTNVTASATIAPSTASYSWSCSGGNLTDTESLTPVWTLPNEPGIYTLSLTVSNLLGTASSTKTLLVKDMETDSYSNPPVVYYSFNGDTENKAENAYDAVSVGAKPTTDKQGNSSKAYHFEFSNQYIYTPNEDALNFTDKITISLWIKPDYLADYEQFVISHGSYEDRYKMSITPEKKMRWTLKTSEGIVDVDDNTVLSAGTFVYYTGVYTGYSLELYRDGNFVAYKALSGSIGTSSKNITLARKDESETNYNFRGTIDEVRIYDNDLPVGFIQKLPDLWSLYSGLNENIIHYNISIYPNPFSSSFSITTPDVNNSFSIEILNLQGQKIWQKKGLQNSSKITPGIKMAEGVYFVRLTSDNGKIYLSKLIKKQY
ncbi:MAG: T9SS type A sorting domain-containing protein [Paludibacter sp.]|nr:T9SS type A sorting domain-containing protein [Paludibacter sp.]